MNCNQIRELMPDLAAGLSATTPQVETHLAGCAECAEKLAGMQQTMALLDEWQSPEPSPYFDVRLQARLREEKASAANRGWLQWIRKPALTAALTILMVAGVTLIKNDQPSGDSNVASIHSANVMAAPGTAVGDLEALDSNHDIFTDFDVLDDLTVQQDVTANP